ncbi:hypothetical protein B0A49_12850, partial [Cryomyces minteri]
MAQDMDLSVAAQEILRPHNGENATPSQVSGSRGLLAKLNHLQEASLCRAAARLSAFLEDLTPFLFVLSYFVVSVSLYIVLPDSIITIFWFVFLATNFYIAASVVTEAFLSVAPCRDARKAVCRIQERGWVFPTADDQLYTLDIVIVAYLPNEKDIIIDRTLYALNEIIYPRDKLRINIVYNTPKPIEPLETELFNLTEKYSNLRVIKVQNSTSKADNLNHFFTINTGSDVMAIFDTDHYPHPYGPRWAMERFHSNKKIDIVQGRCIVLNAGDSLLAGMIAVEFDKIYAVSHPGRAAMWGFGLFCGSNGYWRTDLLREHKMDGEMLTEDIDSALRAFKKGCVAVHELNAVSYELAPITLASFWKQRLRWAQGWAQASTKHVVLTWNKAHEGRRRSFVMRFGVLSLLLIRELSYYLVTQYTCLVFSLVVLHFPKTPAGLGRLVFFQYPLSEWLFIISITSLFATLWITYRVKSEFITLKMFVVFTIFYPIYLVFMATMGLYGHARQVDYLLGLRGLLVLESFLWIFLQTFVPAVVKGADSTTGRTYQVILRKTLSVLFWNENLLYSFFIILSARTICISFIARSTKTEVAGAVFRRALRLWFPVALSLAITYAVFSATGIAYIDEYKRISGNSSFETPYQIPNALAYFNSVFD